MFVFVFGTLITATTAISLQYMFSSKIATDAVTSYATSFARNTQKNVADLNFRASHAVELLAHNASLIKNGKILSEPIDKLFTNLLNSNKEFYAAYIGLSNGDFYELINLEANPSIRKSLGALLTDRYAKVIVEGEGNQRTKRTIFLDEKHNISHEISIFTEYDASVRPWFKNANRIKAAKSKPYLFQHLQSPGQTFSMLVDGTDHVVAIDIALSTMSNFLSNQINLDAAIGRSEVFLYDSKGTLSASNQNTSINTVRPVTPTQLSKQEKAYIQSLPPLRVSNEVDWAPLDYAISGEPRGLIVEKTKMIAQSLGLNIEYVNGVSWNKLVNYFVEGDIEILTPIYKTNSNMDLGLFSRSIIDMKMALATHENTPDYVSIKDLEGKNVAIPTGWSIIPEIQKSYPKVNIVQVATVSDALKAVQLKEVDAALETEMTLLYSQDIYKISNIKILQHFDIHQLLFDSNLRYLFHPKNKQLLALINKALEQFPEEDSLYLQNKWLNNLQGLTKTLSTAVPYNELISLAEQSVNHNILHQLSVESEDKFIFVSQLNGIPDQFFAIVLNADDVLENSREDVYISTAITAAIILFLMPFCWFLANPIVRPIRQLALENEKIMRRKYKQVKRQNSIIKEIDDLSNSLVEMSEAIEEHAERQQSLMDSFVELIAQAIDDKSPYTGGHCHRVPELGLALASVASADSSNYFKDFILDDEDKQREFKLAAWLHDCGKITTPEHVVDKGSKLETNYNRIHEIRTRFEVIWRDAEISYYQQLIANPSHKETLLQVLQEEQYSLVKDFMFVAKCNIGSEAMEETSILKLNQIAQRTWIRHFSDRAGLSPIEERRLKTMESNLPVLEQLLNDKPEHKINWERKPLYDDKFEITLVPPELQNNQGELYNLSTKRGTLNDEERYRINEHTVSTIKILEGLPFPPELANVPRYASTHHETLKGTGYPRGLSAEDLSIGERILVVADIFEALTADDRPYKKAKSLTSALSIMKKMVIEDHIDKHVFNLFLTSNTYMQYAQKHLSEKNIGNIDINNFLT